mmetsp:Transcript_21115/g.68145  ORF Transcript_21115/g.68145 Transcript_21115/m.68145 type:complete len:330 (+) Transcript_21115:53-1042(+)
MPPGNNVTYHHDRSSTIIYIYIQRFPGPTPLGVVRGTSVAPTSAVRNALCPAPLQFAACHSRSTADGGHVRRGNGAGPPSRLSRSRSPSSESRSTECDTSLSTLTSFARHIDTPGMFCAASLAAACDSSLRSSPPTSSTLCPPPARVCGSERPSRCSRSSSADVFGSSSASRPTTSSALRRNLSDSATFVPASTTRRGSDIAKSRRCRGKATPPPRHCGARMEPWRDLPVPFCGRGLRPPPRTSCRDLPARCTCLSAACCATTQRWTRSGRSGRSQTSERSSAIPARASACPAAASQSLTHACTCGSAVDGTSGASRGSNASSRRALRC